MIFKIGRKNFSHYAMDIETHNDDESIEKGETSMWLGCFINEESKVYEDESYFYNMDEFLTRLQELSSSKRKRIDGVLQKRPCTNICVWIYNLSFEWSFLLPYVLKWGFAFKEHIEKDDEMVFNSITTKSVSSVWQVQLKFGKRDGIIVFRDLAKIYGGGLGEVAKAFKLPTQKGEIDYRLNRLHNYVIKCYEKDYCFKDTRIIIDILLKEIELNDKDFFKNVSMASYSVSQLLKAGYPRKMKPYQEFRKDYPELGEEESTFVRKALSGGICYPTREWQFIDINQEILHIDAHQMYPSQVVKKPHPYGYGEYFKGEPKKHFKCLNCCHVRVSYNDVIIHSVIQLIGQNFIEDRELYLWDFEIETMKKCYVDLEIKYIDGYCYKAKFLPWRNKVNDNYLKRVIAKAEGDAYNTLRLKLLNNSGAYGKFVEKPHNFVNENFINPLGIIDSKVSEKEEIKIGAKYTYIPLSTIPAYGRTCLCEHALKFLWNPETKKYDRKNVVYFDTDSIFVIWSPWVEKVWNEEINQNDELGGWGIEDGGLIKKAQFTAPKRYKLDTVKGTIIKAGGINFEKFKETTYKQQFDYFINQGMSRKEALEHVSVQYDEINIISSRWQVQRAYRVKGGTIIQFQEKVMDVQNKYLNVYHTNVKYE